MKKCRNLLMIFGASLLLAGCGDTTEPQNEEQQEQKQNDAASEDNPGEATTDEQKDEDAASEDKQNDTSSDAQTDDDAQSDEPEEKVCPAGFTGENCDQCKEGFVGDNCDECAENLAGENCNIVNSCVHGTSNLGLNGDGHCSECTDVFWGPDCDQVYFCVNGTPNVGIDGDGHCTDCNSDWSGLDCTLANECVNGTANIGLDGDGHCIAGSCLGNYAGENCDRCKADTAEVMYDQVCNEYRATVIDGSTWMAENMAYPNGTYYHVNGDETNDTTYGLLYNWNTATIICPTGWHLPTKTEYEGLLSYASNNNTTSTFLSLIAKSTFWTSYSEKGSDEFGFAALPAGNFSLGKYDHFGKYADFWSATDSDSNHAYKIYIGGSAAYYQEELKSNSLAVRCLKD